MDSKVSEGFPCSKCGTQTGIDWSNGVDRSTETRHTDEEMD
jgi:hypothetical protein